MITPMSFNQVLDFVRRLPPAERAELVAQVVRELATIPVPAPPARLTPAEARAALADIREAIAALPQPRRTLAEQLESDRQERDLALMGYSRNEANDVHT
jgi:hypothetical protein